MRAVVIQHVEMEGAGRIAERCAARSIEISVRHVYAGDRVPDTVGRDEILIVMGGGMGVGDREDPRWPFLDAELALMRSALREDRPILGICLGAQLLAHAAGARVFPQMKRDEQGRTTRVLEVGWGDVSWLGREREPVLAGLAPRQTVLHWHGDTFDLPAGATHLASSALCAHQAFRVGRHTFGLQFHVEVDGDTARRWAVEDADFVRAARGADGPALVIRETEHHAAQAQAAGDRLIDNILDCMTA